MGFSISGSISDSNLVTKKKRTTLTGTSDASSESDEDVPPLLTDSSGSDQEEVVATKPKAARISWRQQWRREIRKLEEMQNEDVRASSGDRKESEADGRRADFGEKETADNVRQCKSRACSDDWNEWAQGVADKQG